MVSNKSVVRMAKLVGSCGALLLLAACSPSMEDVIAENRVAVQAAFDKIIALDAVVASTPPVTEDKMDVGTHRVVLDGDVTNAVFIHADDVKSPEQASDDHVGGTYIGAIETCGQAMSGQPRGVPRGVEFALKDCGSAEFLFVLRARVNQPAEIVEVRSYRPGRFEGDVLLFRLSDGALLGGVSVAGTNADSLMAQVDEAGIPKDLAGRLESELSAQVFVGIREKLREHLPGSVPAATP